MSTLEQWIFNLVLAATLTFGIWREVLFFRLLKRVKILEQKDGKKEIQATKTPAMDYVG
jgi:hypothetical protein